MKHFAVLTCLLLTAVANPAFAAQGNDCAARSEKVKLSEREAFMKSCLSQAGSPSNVKEAKQRHKNARCEQNAKNMKLQGSEKGDYQAECINKNEAVVAANSLPNTAPAHESTSAGQPKASDKAVVPHKAAAKKPAAKKQKEHKKKTKKTEVQ
jgi:hypothetical protein